jgi:tetratricopeptide (TPR) repeat protein
MRKDSPKTAIALVLSTVLLGPAVLFASSPNPMQMPAARREKLTPEQEAVNYFNDGTEYQTKASKLEKEIATEADARKKEKLESKAKDKHEDAVKQFLKATEKNPNFFQAWGSLGYSYRKIGNYSASLEAYNKSLTIQPGYTPAIEYRAEALLGLNQVDEVKSAYMTLFRADRARADELAAAIDKWLEKRKADPAGLDPAKVDEFGKWAEERKQAASRVSTLARPSDGRW